MIWPKYIYYLTRNIKRIASYVISLLGKTATGNDEFDFKAPFKYLKFHIFFRYFLKIIFYGVSVKIPKTTLNSFKKNLKKGQLIVVPTHLFIIEAYPLCELFGKAKQPFYLMVAREFFDLVLGAAAFPLKMAGCFSVSRGSKGARQSLNFAKDIISKTDLPLVMFPEGESSLNLNSLLPLKKGIAIIIEDAIKLKKNIFIQPMVFKISYDPKIIQELNYIADELEWYLQLTSNSLDYREKILYILNSIVDKGLASFNLNSEDSLPLKASLYYDCIKQYLNQKYKIDFQEERAYEIHIKQNKNIQDKDTDLKLIYKWIEIKGLLKKIPDLEEKSPAVWAGLVGKLLRVVYGDYGYESISRIMRFVSIEPVLIPLIPVSFFKNKTKNEILKYLQDLLESANGKVNG